MLRTTTTIIRPLILSWFPVPDIRL